MTSPPLRLSLIVPAFNEEMRIGESLRSIGVFLDGLHYRTELIVVDDGSSEAGRVAVEAAIAALPGGIAASLLRHETNRGKGAAVRSGMLAAKGRFSFFIDADMPYGLDVLETMLDYLDRKEFHVCIGTRARGTSPTLEKRSFARRVASVVFTAVVSRVVVTGIRDTQCGFKGFRTEVARFLFGQSRIDNFAFDIEVLYLAFKNDLDVKRLPVKLERDDNSSVSLLRHALPMLVSMVQIPFRYHSGGYAKKIESAWETEA